MGIVMSIGECIRETDNVMYPRLVFRVEDKNYNQAEETTLWYCINGNYYLLMHNGYAACMHVSIKTNKPWFIFSWVSSYIWVCNNMWLHTYVVWNVCTELATGYIHVLYKLVYRLFCNCIITWVITSVITGCFSVVTMTIVIITNLIMITLCSLFCTLLYILSCHQSVTWLVF